MDPQHPQVAPVSAIFCSEDADVTFKSSDGVVFKLHSANLTACSEGFAPLPGSTFEEIVLLTEDHSTLEILFQFMYPSKHPYPLDMDFDELNQLADAAEKYVVHPAMTMCYLFLKEAIQDHPADVFVYASKYGYSELLAFAAPFTLDIPPSAILGQMAESCFLPWVEYQASRQEIQKRALTLHVPPAIQFSYRELYFETATKLAGSLQILEHLSEAFPPTSNVLLQEWCFAISRDVLRAPTFGEILSKYRPNQGDGTAANDEMEKYKQLWTPGTGTDNPVTYQSQEGDLFTIPRRNVLALSGNLSTAPEVEAGEDDPPIIRLNYDTATLQYLFPFLFPVKPPALDIQTVPDAQFQKISAAAAECKVYPAMNLCRFRLYHSESSSPTWTFQYAAENEYLEILDSIAPAMVRRPLQEVVPALPRQYISAYLQYYDRWESVVKEAIVFGLQFKVTPREIVGAPGQIRHITRACPTCTSLAPDFSTMRIMAVLGVGFLNQMNTGIRILFDHLQTSACCQTRAIELRAWEERIEDAISKIPLFSTFLA